MRLAQVLQLFATESWRNVDAGLSRKATVSDSLRVGEMNEMLGRQRPVLLSWVTGLILLVGACSDFKESNYTSMAEARRAGAIDRGWLPNILPDSVTNIRERHNIDTNETWCAFELTPPAAATLRSKLSPIKPADLMTTTIRTPGAQWWPAVLERHLEPAAIDKAGMNLYTSGSLLFALASDGRRGFMYRAHAR